MTTSATTFRLPADLHTQASKKAKRMGITLTAVIKQALKDFLTKQEIIISDIEEIEIPKDKQEKVKTISTKLSKL